MVNYKINVYLKHTEMENMYVREFIELVTQDINGNNFEFTVYEGDNVYDLTNKRVTMVVKSDSGTVIQENCQVVDAKQGKATITLPPDMLIENGPYMAEVQVWEGVNSRVTTLPFDYTVRLSLENDESIKADPRFSLLQVALKNVNDADSKSKEALTISKEAEAICDDLVPKANTASQNAQEALDRALDVATKTELDERITLNDATQTNFNFICSNVEQNGLVYENIKGFEGTQEIQFIDTGILFDKNKEYTIFGSFVAKTPMVGVTGNRSIFGTTSTYQFQGWNVEIGGVSQAKTIGIITNKTGNEYSTRSTKKYEYGVPTHVVLQYSNGVFKLITQNECITHMQQFDTVGNILLGNTTQSACISGQNYNFLIYNRQLTPKEIQHNFSVLNNSPSIKELHTTDSTGKTSILKLASNEDHVEMSTGRTLREEYMGVLKTMGKEFTSTDGSPIEVNNGVEARLISGEIKGQTVKNYCPTIKKSNMSISGLTSVDDEKHLITLNGDGVFNNAFINYNGGLEPNKKYKVVIYIHSNTMSGNIIICGTSIDEVWSTGSIYVKQGENGIVSSILTTKEDLSNTKQIARTYSSSANPTGTLVYSVIVIDENDPVPTSYIPFGLHSTKAIISNNGQQYPIYEPTILGKTRILDADTGLVPTDPTLPALKDGDVLDLATRTITFANKTTRVLTDEEVKAYSAFKKVISLRGVGDVANKLKLNEDGSATWIDDTISLILNGVENWAKSGLSNTEYSLFYLNGVSKNRGRVLCDKLNTYPYPFGESTADKEGIAVIGDGSLRISIKNEKLTSPTVEGFKSYLKQQYDAGNPIVICCQSPSTVITPIPKELVPTILTNQTNILEVGGAVKPSSFKVTLPVDRIAELTARLEAVEAKTNTQPVNTAFVDETYAKSVNKIEEVIK